MCAIAPFFEPIVSVVCARVMLSARGCTGRRFILKAGEMWRPANAALRRTSFQRGRVRAPRTQKEKPSAADSSRKSAMVRPSFARSEAACSQARPARSPEATAGALPQSAGARWRNRRPRWPRAPRVASGRPPAVAQAGLCFGRHAECPRAGPQRETMRMTSRRASHRPSARGERGARPRAGAGRGGRGRGHRRDARARGRRGRRGAGRPAVLARAARGPEAGGGPGRTTCSLGWLLARLHRRRALHG